MGTSQSICQDSYHICYENRPKKNKTLTSQDSKGQVDHGQRRLNNILVNKSVLNDINKEGRFTQGFKD